MALNVRFFKGLKTDYDSLEEKDKNAFYYITDEDGKYYKEVEVKDDIEENLSIVEIQKSPDIKDEEFGVKVPEIPSKKDNYSYF